MKDLVIGRKYKTKDGEEKTQWVNFGTMMDGDKGPFLLVDPAVNLAAFMTPGKDRVIVSIFDKKPKKDEVDQRPNDEAGF